MRFTVVIPTARGATVGSTIRSIQAQSWQDWELFAVTQGDDSDDARRAVETAARGDGRVHGLHLDVRGASRARNAGAAAGSGEVVAMIDDDCEAAPDWLASIAAYLDDHPDVGLVGGAVVAPAGGNRRLSVCPTVTPTEAIYDPARTPGAPPPGWDWIGCNVAVRRAVLDRLGGLDPGLGPGTEFPVGDDTDLKLRLEAAGVAMGVTPSLVVHHTYGRRDGLRAVLRNATNYGRGNGGLAGKLSLSGDPRGREWLTVVRRRALTGWSPRRPWTLLAEVYRLATFTSGYRRCLRGYRIGGDGMLERAG